MELAAAGRAVPADPFENLFPRAERKRQNDHFNLDAPEPYKLYEGLYVFSPSVQIDSAWDPVKEFVKNLKHSGFYHEWDEKALVDILDTRRANIKEMKDTKIPVPDTRDRRRHGGQTRRDAQ